MDDGETEQRVLPAPGTQAERSRTVTRDDIARFAEVSGDRNPVHLDETFAQTTPFGGTIAQGMLTASLISAVLGNDLPGPGAIYLKQTLSFLKPVYPGDTIIARVEVTELRAEKRLAVLRTEAVNQHGERVVTGEAVVKC